jgi:hypothetical protein
MEDLGEFGRSVNRMRWDQSAPLPAESAYYDPEAFRAGRDDIRPFEFGELGPVAGLDLVHLQCHIGTDTLSWARHGASVVGLDFSPAAIDIAERLAAECHPDAEFVCADVYDSARALGGRQFDIVYTGIGALGWLPDVNRWAEVDGVLRRPLVEVIEHRRPMPTRARWSTEDNRGPDAHR